MPTDDRSELSVRRQWVSCFGTNPEECSVSAVRPAHGTFRGLRRANFRSLAEVGASGT